MEALVNVLVLTKGEERYIFLFGDERKSETLRSLGRFAADPELSFSWYDAAVLSQRIRKEVSNTGAPRIAEDFSSESRHYRVTMRQVLLPVDG